MTETRRIGTPFSYSSAVAAGDFVFLAMHRGSGDDFATQFDSTFSHLRKTQAEFDLALADVVKVNVWLKHMVSPTAEINNGMKLAVPKLGIR